MKKTRYAVPYAELMIEVDEYHGSLEGLYTLECEFQSVEAAASFVLPEWAGRAVDGTSESRRKGKALASRSRVPA